MRFRKCKNAKFRFQGVFTCLVTRGDQVSEESVAGAAGRFSFCIKGPDENGVARAFAERVRGGPWMDLYGGSNARVTPPRRAP